MTERCEPCQRDFDSAEALQMHNQAKHAEAAKTGGLAGLTSTQKKKLRNWVLAFVLLGLIIFGFGFWVKSSRTIDDADDTIPDFEVPKRPIHWHPHLTIRIDGQEIRIPKDVGITSTVHYPIHTHEEDNILHLENNNPTKETVILGYFFKVWGKKFNQECIFDHCTEKGTKGTLKMYVNGKENFAYQNYFMQDKDEIVIEYTSLS
ncbi:MAG: hypothetical protein AABX13_05305 [Nanoarchaeota archaeon]